MKDSSRLDLVLKLLVTFFVVALLGLAGYFGWTVYADRMLAEDATPALRLIKGLKQQVREHPNDVALRIRLGEALAAAGKKQEAIEQLNQALKADPNHTGALLDLGQIAVMSGDRDAATEYYKKVVKITDQAGYQSINDRREVALYQLGRLSLADKKFEDSIGYFKAALRIRKDASDTYYYLALAFTQIDDREEAMAQLRNAVAFDPNFAQARYFLGTLLLEDGDKVGASYEFAHAVKVDPEAKEPRQALKKLGDSKELAEQAKAKLAADDLDGAYEDIQLAINIDPENVEAVRLAGEIFTEKGDKQKAIEAYNRLLELKPDDAAAKAAVKKLQASIDKSKKK